MAALHQLRIEVRGRLAQIVHLEPRHRHIGLVAVLLPEHPLQHARPVIGVRGDQVGAFGQMQDDGVGLGERPAVAQHHRRNLPRRVQGQELRRPGLGLEDAGLDPVIGEAQVIGGPLHLQTVAGNRVAVDAHMRAPQKGTYRGLIP